MPGLSDIVVSIKVIAEPSREERLADVAGEAKWWLERYLFIERGRAATGLGMTPFEQQAKALFEEVVALLPG